MDNNYPRAPQKAKRSPASQMTGVAPEGAVKPDSQRPGESAVSNAATPPTPRATVPVTSMWPGHLVVEGTPSGAVYEWSRGGGVVEVNPVDVEFLRSKNHHGSRPCCGGAGERIMFKFPND